MKYFENTVLVGMMTCVKVTNLPLGELRKEGKNNDNYVQDLRSGKREISQEDKF